jgi:predicted outer membrane repeat protein
MRRILCFSFTILLLLAGTSSATIWNVAPDGTGTAPNIQAAIDSCASGDTVLAAPGTYTGAGNRDIDFTGKAIVVRSLSGPAVTIIDCGGSAGEYHRGFYFHSGEDTTSVLQGFTIRNGYSDEGGAICCRASSPRILGNVVTGNFALNGGGGIYCEGTHSIISGNTISHNEVSIWMAKAKEAGIARPFDRVRHETTGSFPPSGGNICCIADSSLVESNAISGGIGTLGSAIYCEGSLVRVRHNTITANGSAYTEGTACFLSGNYSIEENTISNNHTWNNGAGLYCSGGEYRIVGNIVSNNEGFCQSGGAGGGMYCGGGNYTIENNDIAGNRIPSAGGIFFAGSGSIRSNRITGNYTEFAGPCKSYRTNSEDLASDLESGGGIAVYGAGPLVIANNVITENSASWGGGISCINASSGIEITENIIARNGASQNPCGLGDMHGGMGGGIYCYGASPVIARNTIYANGAGNDEADYASGAGIFCAAGSSPQIHRNIIANNHVYNSQNAGGIYCVDSTSAPSALYNDAYGNANANYGGTLADQNGLNGNFSLDPLFCGAENGDFNLHVLSPCLSGRHPGGEDCGTIGALGSACESVATLLQGYSTSVSSSAVTITWTLAQAGEDLTCSVFRTEARNGEYIELPAAAIAREGLAFTLNDAGFDPGTAYRYRVDVSDSEGRKVLFETSRIVTPALPLGLSQNFPNPFNPSTTISYYLPEDSPVTLAVYDVSGRRIADLVGKTEKKGRYSVTWNGKEEAGGSVASGIYFYRLAAGNETVSRKMILMR